VIILFGVDFAASGCPPPLGLVRFDEGGPGEAFLEKLRNIGVVVRTYMGETDRQQLIESWRWSKAKDWELSPEHQSIGGAP